MSPLRVLIVTALMLLVMGCGNAASPISNSELSQRVVGDNAPMILDVRSGQEYASGHVPGAINIPVDQLSAHLPELRRHDNAEIVVYCESGRRASKAADILIGDGFLNVRHLEGDMRQWRRDGLPMASGN
jgi:phage shock protein E